MSFSSTKPTRFWSRCAVIFCFVFISGRKKSSPGPGIKHDLHSDTAPLDSLSTFWNYRNRLIWETKTVLLYLCLRGKCKCSLFLWWSPSTSGSDRCLWRMTFGRPPPPWQVSPSTSWDPSPKRTVHSLAFWVKYVFPRLYPPSPWSSVLHEGWWMAAPVLMLILDIGVVSLLLTSLRDLLFFSHLIGNWVGNGYGSRE